ncbi:MAG: hypothetical protein KGI29_10050 [Pseudomonadota bacterium]|nr:hypothetical protein [Pseudomonadota bacterium]MDE3038381.1 hypothetical protein [Pseudomonadota bacterium]
MMHANNVISPATRFPLFARQGGGKWRSWLRRYLLLLLFVAAQFGYWWRTHGITPDFGIVPDPPGRAALHAMSFGDDEFYFRSLALMIQNAGDTYGRFSPLRYYDFSKLYLWFNLLDELDSRSNMIPSMACYYFSQTQNTPDVRYVVDYLYAHSTRDVAHNWWWLVQSIYLAMHKLHDMDLALKVAKPLVNPDVPAWAQQMTAVVYEKRGEMDDALSIMETIKKHAKEITPADLAYMRYFVEERLYRLKQLEGKAPMAPPEAIGPAPEHP